MQWDYDFMWTVLRLVDLKLKRSSIDPYLTRLVVDAMTAPSTLSDDEVAALKASTAAETEISEYKLHEWIVALTAALWSTSRRKRKHDWHYRFNTDVDRYADIISMAKTLHEIHGNHAFDGNCQFYDVVDALALRINSADADIGVTTIALKNWYYEILTEHSDALRASG